jgi:FMN phosphatase YigB (HAD superfamily)
MKYIVCDIDGTIVNVHPERLKFLEQERKDWDSFYEMCFIDEPKNEIISVLRAIWVYQNNVELEPTDIMFCT